jgi:NitT/TauT family transport system substrate-binding protein
MKCQKRIGVWLQASLLGLIGLIAQSWVTNAQAQEKSTILCGYDVLMMQCYVADKQGFFHDEGLDVTVKYSVSGKVAIDGVVAGAGVMGIASSLVSVTAASSGPIYIVAPLGRSEYLVQMVSRAEISHPTDLRGKRIGFQFGTEGHRFALEYLKSNGLSSKDVTLVNIPVQALPAALSRGDVDAIAAWPPHTNKAIEATHGATILATSKGILSPYGVAVMRKDFVQANPEGARKLLRGLMLATKFIKENPSRTIEYFAKQGDIQVELAKGIFGDMKPEYSMAIDTPFFAESKRTSDFLFDNGFTKEHARPKDFIYEKLLRDIAPDLVHH